MSGARGKDGKNGTGPVRVPVAPRSSPLAYVDRPWSGYPLGTKAHGCGGGYWVRVALGWQYNGRHGIFPTPGGDACGACIELPNNKLTHSEPKENDK
jgi:hypothetical protein